jgi:hypothetical protein
LAVERNDLVVTQHNLHGIWGWDLNRNRNRNRRDLNLSEGGVWGGGGGGQAFRKGSHGIFI